MHEGSLGKNRPTIIFGWETPTKEDWTLWRTELSKIKTLAFKLLTPLDRWNHSSACVWRYYYDENKDKIQAKSEGDTEVYTRMDGRSRRYSHSHTKEDTAIIGHLATLVELEGGALRMQEVGHSQVIETDEEQEDFLPHLKNYGGEWFWEDIQAPMVQNGQQKQ